MTYNCKNKNGDYITKTSSTEEKITGDDARLMPMQPGKGLMMFSITLSEFCQSPDNAPLYEVRKGTIIPKARPDHHKLSFVDDPPYSTTVGKYLLRSYQMSNCMGCVDTFYKNNSEKNDINLKSDEIVLLRAKLPKWIHVNDFVH